MLNIHFSFYRSGEIVSSGPNSGIPLLIPTQQYYYYYNNSPVHSQKNSTAYPVIPQRPRLSNTGTNSSSNNNHTGTLRGNSGTKMKWFGSKASYDTGPQLLSLSPLRLDEDDDGCGDNASNSVFFPPSAPATPVEMKRRPRGRSKFIFISYTHYSGEMLCLWLWAFRFT